MTELVGTRSVRLIVDPELDGRWNMAVDEALLESVSAADSGPVIRLYGFRPATLSVGRFQRSDGAVDFERLAADGALFVRRPSGGQAVLHTEELTYAIVLGRPDLEPFGKRQVYRFAAPLLLAGLRAAGVGAAKENASQRGNPMNPDCFGSTGEYEIDSDAGRKLVGSAQMITRTAVLQHGSIPLSDASRKVETYLLGAQRGSDHSSNVAQELGRAVTFEEARSAFAIAIRSLLSVADGELTPAERSCAERLLDAKYSRDEWNRKY